MSSIWTLDNEIPRESFELCTGYLRQASTIAQIPQIVHDICFTYYEPNSINNIIKNAPVGYGIISQIFIINGFKWLFKFCPHQYSINAKICHFNIYLLSTPKIIKTVTTNIHISLSNTLHKFNKNNFSFNHKRHHVTTVFKLDAFESLYHPQFEINIDIVSVTNKNNAPVANYQQMLNTSTKTLSDEYIWKISPQEIQQAIQNQSLQSEFPHKQNKIFESSLFTMHGFKWYLFISSAGLHIVNATIPSSISYIRLLLQFTWKEKDNFVDHVIITFSTDSGPRKIKTCDINYKDYKHLEFGIKATLIDIYDVSHMPITNKYISDQNNYPCTELPSSEPFIWNIPEKEDRAENLRQYDLCRGYIREIHQDSNENVANSIIALCIEYLNASLMGSDLGRLRRSEDTSMDIFSTIFMRDGFKWIVCIRSRVGGDIYLETKPIIVPVSISKLKAKCSLIFKEVGYKFSDIVWFQGHALSTYHIDPKIIPYLQSMSFIINIDVLDVVQASDSMASNYKELLNPSQRIINSVYQISLDNGACNRIKDHGHYEFFEVFGFTCCISIDPNRNMKLHIRKKSDDNAYAFVFKIVCNELYLDYHCFSKLWSPYSRFIDKSYSISDNADLRYFKEEKDSILIVINIELSDVYIYRGENKGRLLTNDFAKDTISKRLYPISISHSKWRLPSMTANEAALICYGFIRTYSKKYTTHVPSDIIDLLVIFVFDDIDHTESIRKAFRTGTECEMSLDAIKMDVFKWKMNLRANSSGLHGYLELSSISPMISAIFCHVILKCKEANYITDVMRNFQTYDPLYHFYYVLLRNPRFEWNTLTFEVELRILDVFSRGIMLSYDLSEDIHNGKIHSEKSIANDYRKYQQQSDYSPIMATGEFVCIINPELMLHEGYKSEIFRMFGLDWQLYLDDEEGMNEFFYVRLRLIKMPVHAHVLQLQYESKWEDNNKIHKAKDSAKYTRKKMHKSVWPNYYDQAVIRRDTLQDLEKIEFRLQLTLFDVYDINGFCISDRFINSENTCDIIKKWLENDLKLGKYYQLFVQYGLRNKEDVLTLNMEKLDIMGIKTIDDKIKILHHIDKLKQIID